MIDYIIVNLKNETDKESALSKKIANVLVAKNNKLNEIGSVTGVIKAHLEESGLTLSKLASAILLEVPASLYGGIGSVIYTNKNKSAKYVASSIIKRCISYLSNKDEIKIYKEIIEKDL